jgi:hypothetical protein
MSTTSIVYVTRGGHSRALALDLGARLGAEVGEIADLVGRKGLFGWLRSGRQATMKMATPIGDPGLDLRAAATVVIVQPVWASAVCPPIRSWLRAHAKELAGKRVAVLASAYGSLAQVLRDAFDSEFRAELGPLAACSVVLQRADPAARSKAIDDFIAELNRK